MKTLINEKDYRNGRIDIEIKINELKGNFNEMSIEINKKKKLQQLEQVANLSTYPSRHFNSLNMRNDTSRYSNTPKKESINMIDIYNISHKEYPKDFGNPTPISEPVTKSSSSSPTLTSIEESDLIWEEFKAYLASNSFPPGNSNPSSPFPHFHNSLSGSTTSSSPSLPIFETSNYSLEEFADELAHLTFPPGINYLPFDAESDLREIEYLLNHDPIKEMDSILEDSVDENSPDDNLVDTTSEMVTDEHDLDYSSPPLWDDYDDELFDLDR
ncbi:hypothetical protein Tco_0610108 [Tanacetum coccineum]